MPLSIFGIWSPRSSTTWRSCAGRDAHGRLPHVELDPELAKGGHDRDQVVGLDVLDRHLAARRRGERGEARHLDVLGADPVRPASEAVDALDAEDVRADPLDPRAERHEEVAEILDVRLACGVADDRLALREHRGHHCVLRRHDARLVEEHALPDEPRRAQVVRAVELDVDPQLGERVDVRVEPAAADDVAARRRDGGASEAREERAGEQERRADLAPERRMRARSSRRRRSRRSPRSARSTRRRRRGRRAARPSSPRRESAGRW